jgi:alkylation response protein AidB-like acyl-CoA dehydrogenase
MNFQHTEDRRMLADSLNRFISEQYSFATRDRIAQSAEGFSAELWGRFAELGIIGALFDEAHGGFGGAGFDIAVVFESLGRGLVVELSHAAATRRNRRC